MGRFKDAFGKGIEAHESAERATLEIVQVLAAFGSDVKEVSGGAIEVYRSKKDVVGGLLRTIELGPKNKLPPIEPYDMLIAVAVLPEGLVVDDSRFKLAEYTLSAAGYPVSVSYSDVTVQCHDRASLEAALAQMLEHPDTGGKLLRLMRTSRKHGGKGGSQAAAADNKDSALEEMGEREPKKPE